MSKNYINNKDLYYEIVVSKAKGELTPKAQLMFKILGERVIKKFSYISEELREDCLMTAYSIIYNPKRWMSFDEERFDNAFAFFTEVFKRGLAAGYNKSHSVISVPSTQQDNVKLTIISLSGINGGEGAFNL